MELNTNGVLYRMNDRRIDARIVIFLGVVFVCLLHPTKRKTPQKYHEAKGCDIRSRGFLNAPKTQDLTQISHARSGSFAVDTRARHRA